MTITVSTLPRSEEFADADSIGGRHWGQLFRDRDDALYVCIESTDRRGHLARVRDEHLDLDCSPYFPVRLAEAGATITITQEA